MSFQARIVLALTAMLVLAGCRIEVYDGLTQRDANEMTAVLVKAGVEARRTRAKDGTFAVEVDEADFADAVTIIGQSGLPKPSFATMTDVLSDDRLIASPSEERARLNYALSQELSRTVSEIEGVVTARVHLATPSDDPLSRRDSKSSASVAIHHRDAFTTAGVVPRIKTLIANAVDGLEYDRVSIALFPTFEASDTAAASVRVADAGSEFEDPSPRMPRAVTPARVEGFGITPALAAILGGGLIVLLLVAQSLVGGMKRRSTATRSRGGEDRSAR